LANWTRVAWQMTGRDSDRDAAWRYALHAQELDPVSREGWLTEANLCTLFGQHLQLRSLTSTLAVSIPWGPFPNLQLPPQPLGTLAFYSHIQTARRAQVEFERAINAFAEAVRLGPTQTGIRFQLVSALHVAGYDKEARREARRLLDIDRETTHRSRRLTPDQREQIQRWLEGSSK
jgi:hypothetical protein